MFELTLSAPQALVEPVSDALMDELGSLSVTPMPTRTPRRRCSANPACRHHNRAGNGRR
jgi:hypothetical protein